MSNAMTPNEMFEYGEKLIADAHREYESQCEDGVNEDDAYWYTFDGFNTDNYGLLAVIWASGALSSVFDSDDVMDAIKEAICFG